jgi:hypothetical protein
VWEPRFNSFSARKPFQGEGFCEEATGRSRQSADADESGAVPIPEPLRPPDLADPDPGNLDSLAERGRGLYLIHRLMDAVGRS